MSSRHSVGRDEGSEIRARDSRSDGSYFQTLPEADFREVRGVGHSSADMLQSRRARNAMFRG